MGGNPVPWIGLLALVAMFVIPFLPSWIFEGPRERILAVATRLFLEEGIQAVGVARIVEEAQVAPMTRRRG